MSPVKFIWNRALRFLLGGTLLLQTGILLACAALGYANTQAGLLQYRLPPFLFWVYLWVSIGAPLCALAILVFLWARRSTLWDPSNSTKTRTLRYLIFLCIANVGALAVWFNFVGVVFFAAGGNR